jgi:hypothetical protein
MKRIMKIAVLAGVILLVSSLRNNISAQPYDDYDYDQGRDVSYQTFYDELSPHGRWIEYPGQGYVWVPDAGPDFRPYSTNGHWVWTDNYEWMWVSDYDWGWAPFHYGRWDYDEYYGWYWVPGYEWSPAWVAWRDGGDYYGWAPIRPGINISINFNIGGYAPPVNFWSFAPRRYILSPRIYDYCYDWRRNSTIINHTTIIVNNYNYSRNYGFRTGPRRYDAERYIGRINPVRFRQSNTPGRTFYRNNEVSVYRPSIRQNSDRQIAPRNFERYDRSNGSFRNRNTNTADTRRDDNTFRNRNTNTSDTRRDDNFRNRDNAVNTRPGRQERTNDQMSRRNEDGGFRQPQRNDNNLPQPDRRRIERTDNDRQPQMDRRQEQRQPQFERRNERPQQEQMERRVERPQPQIDRRMERPQPQQDDRRLERSQPQMERRMERPQQQERRVERQQPQVERRMERPQQQQMERRVEQRQPQMERRVERQQPQERQEQPRAERQGNSGNGNGKGRGRF